MMQISVLAIQLMKLYEEHGDIEVNVVDPNGVPYDFAIIENEDDGEIVVDLSCVE